MTIANLPYVTHLGLPGLDRVHFGMHACHFHDGSDELLSVLVPYFVAGLRGNEHCLWITAAPVDSREAVHALRAAWEGCEEAIQAGALRIIEGAALTGIDRAKLWIDEEARAIEAGYGGLRIAANSGFPPPASRSSFMKYERELNERLNGRRIVMLCSYPLMQHCNHQMDEIMHLHHCASRRLVADTNAFVVSRFRHGSQQELQP